MSGKAYSVASSPVNSSSRIGGETVNTTLLKSSGIGVQRTRRDKHGVAESTCNEGADKDATEDCRHLLLILIN